MGKKQEIWLRYIEMKRNNSKNLSTFLNDPYVKKVIDKKDFDVCRTKRSNLYHRSSCGYLSRSRNLYHMKRSYAIVHGYLKCNACIKGEINSTWAIICIVFSIIFGIILGCMQL